MLYPAGLNLEDLSIVLPNTVDNVFWALLRCFEAHQHHFGEAFQVTWHHLITNGSTDLSERYHQIKLVVSKETWNYTHLWGLLMLWMHGLRIEYSPEINEARSSNRCVEMLSTDGFDVLEDSLESYVGDLTAYDCRYGVLDSVNHRKKKRRIGPIFGMSRERVWNKSPGQSQHGYLLASLRYPLATQCALDIVSGLTDAIARQVRQLPLDGIQLRPTILAELADDISIAIRRSGLVNRKKDAMMLVYPAFLHEGLLPRIKQSGYVRNTSNEPSSLEYSSYTAASTDSEEST